MMQNQRGVRRLAAASVTAIMVVWPHASVCAAPPVVQGPESVQDWWAAGQRFIDQSREIQRIDRRAKNVILFIGDGMGVSTVTASRILEGQTRGKPGEENLLSFERFPHLGLSKTYSWDQQTSDSAPTMTAIVTGYKTRDSMLSVNHMTSRYECDANIIAANSLQTILEQAAGHGKATGVVSTARLTHATPAANYAHTAVRDWESDADIREYETANKFTAGSCTVKDIARQLLELPDAVRESLKVAMGGGRSAFMPETLVDPEDGGTNWGRRKDGRDLTQEWVKTRGAGARFVFDQAGFDAANAEDTSYLLGLFERSHMEYAVDRPADKGGEPSLTAMTERAIEILSKNRRGFYLHVEGGRIDHAHHAGNPYRALTDTIEFAKAIQKAYEKTDPRETLIIVSADHSHVFTMAGYPHRGNPILGKVKGVPDHDGEPAVFSEDALGLPYTTLGYANGLGYTGVSDSQPAGIKKYPHTPKSFTNGALRPDLTSVDTGDSNFMPETTAPMELETHGGEDVAIYATGPRAYLVRGVMEQNWIFHVMRVAFGF